MSAGASTPARTSVPPVAEYRRRQRRLVKDRLVIWVVLVGAVIWAIQGTGFGVWTFVQGLQVSLEFLFEDLLPPRWEVAPNFIGPTLDTVYMSVVGMVISVVFSIPMGILAAKNTTVNRGVAYLAKTLTAFIRAVPEIVFGIFLVAVVGVGPLAGALAIGIGGIGILGKAYADGIEKIDAREIEGIRSTGASWLQVMGQGVWPQFKPTFTTWSLYRLDLNIREAAVLGLVGAGGLGYSLQGAISLFQFKSAATIILMIFGLILLIELITGWLRRKAL